MKLGPSIASATFVFAFCQCGPLVNDPPLDGGKATSGNSGSGSMTGSTSGSVAEASMSGSTAGDTSGASATGASGASSGATTGDDTDSATTGTDTGSSGSSAGTSGASGSGGPDATMQGNNLVLNGDFSQGGMYWGISSGTGDIDAGTNQLCVSVGMGSGTVYLGWPQPSSMAGMSLASGTKYTFSYKAQTSQGNLTVEAKVANSMGSSNYMPVDSDSTMDMVTGSLQSFTHTFTPTSNDMSAGVVFIFSSQSTDTICFESVSVVAQ